MNNAFIALIGAIGISLLLEVLFSPFHALVDAARERLPRRNLVDRAAGTSPSGQVAREAAFDRVTAFQKMPVLDRMLAPLLEDYGRRQSDGRKQELMDRLRRAGFPYETAGDYYASKLISGLMGFLLGIVIVVITGSTAFIFLAVLFAVLGATQPDQKIDQQTKERARMIYTEMAFTLDRIATLVESGMDVVTAMEALSKSPGGLFIAEIRMMMTDLGVGKRSREALDAMRARLPKVDEIDAFCERVLMSTEGGQSIAPGLRAQAARMRRKVESDILSRGLQRLLYVTAVGMATLIPGAMLTLAAMPILNAVQALR